MARQSSPRREFWLTHLRQWRAQGGTMKAYAQANELSVDNFYAAKSAYSREPMSSQGTGVPKVASVTLLPVQVASRDACDESLRVSLPNGVRIEVPGGVGVEQWRTLLDALGHRG